MNVKGKKKRLWDCEMHIRMTKTFMADIDEQIEKRDDRISRNTYAYIALVEKVKRDKENK